MIDGDSDLEIIYCWVVCVKVVQSDGLDFIFS